MSQSITSLISKSFWSISDQAIFAVSNLALNLLLLRLVSGYEYGVFVTLYSIFLLFLTVENALLIEPMLVFGISEYKQEYRKYLGQVLWLHFSFQMVLFLLMAMLIVLSSLLDINIIPVKYLIILAFAQPFMLTMWLVRRASYVNLQPRLSAVTGLLNLILTLGLVFLFNQFNQLNISTIFLTIVSASFVVSVIIIWFLKIDLGFDQTLFFHLVNQHFHFGKWLVISALFTWIPRNIYYFLLPLWWGTVGLEFSASLKAHSLFVEPIVQGFTAIGILIIPLLSVSEEVSIMRKQLNRFWLGGFGFALIYMFIVYLLGDQIAAIIELENYNKALILGFSSLPFLTLTINLLGGVLRARKKTPRISLAFLAGAILTVTFGFWFTVKLELIGAIASMLISYLGVALILFVFYAKEARHVLVK